MDNYLDDYYYSDYSATIVKITWQVYTSMAIINYENTQLWPLVISEDAKITVETMAS